MDLTPVISRLKAQLSGFKSIGGTVDLDSAASGTVATPSAFVMPLAYRGEPSNMLGVHEQRITEGFAVILVVSNKRDTTGAASLDDLSPLCQQVRDALAGWVPIPADGEPVQITGGRLLGLIDGRLWWIDEFNVLTYYRRA